MALSTRNVLFVGLILLPLYAALDQKDALGQKPGCSQCQDGCCNHPRHSFWSHHNRSCFGWYVHNAMYTQIAQGSADRMVLYHYDFLEGADADRLSFRGHYQLTKLIQRLLVSGNPIVIQSTPQDPQIADRRRANVAAELRQLEPGATDDMVVVGRPRAIGLRSADSTIIFNNRLKNTDERGVLRTNSNRGNGAAVILPGSNNQNF